MIPLTSAFTTAGWTITTNPSPDPIIPIDKEEAVEPLPEVSSSENSCSTFPTSDKEKVDAIMEKNLRNYPRLYDKGASMINHPLVQAKLQSHREQNVLGTILFKFDVSLPQDILAANLHVDEVIRGQTFAEIRNNPDYAEYSLKVSQSDFKDTGAHSSSIITTLQKVHLITQYDRLIVQALSNPEVLKSLAEAIQKPEVVDKILDVLHCVKYRSTDSAILRCLIDSKILDPRILIEMSRGKISLEQARALLACLAVKVPNKKPYPVMDLETNEYNQGIVEIIRKKSPPALQLLPTSSELDRETIDQEYCDSIEQLSAFYEPLVAKIDAVKKRILDLLEPFYPYVSQEFLERFKKAFDEETIFNTATLHTWFFKPAGWYEEWRNNLNHQPLSMQGLDLQWVRSTNSLSDEVTDAQEAFDLTGDKIHRYFLKTLPKIQEFVQGNLPSDEDYQKAALDNERKLKLWEASTNGDLNETFHQTQHVLSLFLRYSTQQFNLKSCMSYKIKWALNGIHVEESLTREKSGVVARRLDFPHVEGKKDLVYFSENSDSNSILKSWVELQKKYQLKDAQLADYCLNLYYKGHAEAPEEIRQFLAPLVLLILGKEPSLDRASLLSNFILLNSVKMGLFSFKQALKTMPMIPIGAVSSKQFLLHLINRPIDSMTYVQSKKAKENGSSFFLPHTVDVLGRADKWLQKYDDVTTAAVRCCVHILSSMDPVPTDDSDLNQLKIILEQLYGNIEIPHEELGEALDQEAGLLDNEDLVGEWVVNYLFKLHPLSKTLV